MKYSEGAQVQLTGIVSEIHRYANHDRDNICLKLNSGYECYRLFVSRSEIYDIGDIATFEGIVKKCHFNSTYDIDLQKRDIILENIPESDISIELPNRKCSLHIKNCKVIRRTPLGLYEVTISDGQKILARSKEITIER